MSEEGKEQDAKEDACGERNEGRNATTWRDDLRLAGGFNGFFQFLVVGRGYLCCSSGLVPVADSVRTTVEWLLERSLLGSENEEAVP